MENKPVEVDGQKMSEEELEKLKNDPKIRLKKLKEDSYQKLVKLEG